MPRTKKSDTAVMEVTPQKKTSTPGNSLLAEVTELRKAYLLLQLKAATGELRQPHLLRQARRDIARKLTVLNAQ